ncbi:DUF2726 domain-containing protein [Rhodobacterales bacterium HKCCE4037]|nr:DUF2726 domain-containing protein [Rhodobacterales bacterium HKCCE4037]
MAESTYLVLIVVLAVCFGLMIGCFALLDPVLKRKRIRATAELRRQARGYQARLSEMEAKHAAEIAVLRETIRFEQSKTRPHDAVARATIKKKPILNRSEALLFSRLDAFISRLPNSERVFPQVALVEFFMARAMNGDPEIRNAAYEAYGKMRCDFLVVDRNGYPLCGIEYQGSGHHQGNFAYREQIKREVFRKAGVPLVEIGSDDPWDETETAVRAALRAPLLAA